MNDHGPAGWASPSSAGDISPWRSWDSEQNLVRLPTTWLLHYVHQRVAPPQRFTFTGTYLPGASGRTTFTVSNPKPVRLNVVATPSPMPASAYPVASPNRWKSMLPGAANLEAFSIVGQCLF